MEMLLCEPGSWACTTYFMKSKLAMLLVCRNESLQGTVSSKPSHVSQHVLSNDSLALATQSVIASLL